MKAEQPDEFIAVREALRQDNPLWTVQHVDITCDGCEAEPILGHRFKCTVCEDIDLCGACMRALVAARLKMSQEVGSTPAPPRQGHRPRRWVSKLHSRDLSAKWAALQTAVPCLHPSHRFQKVLDGPERAVVFHAGRSSQQAAGSGPAASISGDSGAEPRSSSSSSNSPASGGLEQFLATFPPSACSCRDVAWIVVAQPEDEEAGGGSAQRQQQQQPDSTGAAVGAGGSGGSGGSSLEERVDAAVEEWEQLTAAAAASKRRLTTADVDRLAAKHRILKGKWMLFARSAAEADATWAAVARAVCGEQAAVAATTAAPVVPASQQQAGQEGGEPQSQQQQEQQEQQEQQQHVQEQQPGHERQQQEQLEQQQQRRQQQRQQGEQPGRPLRQSAKVSSSSPDGSWVLCIYTTNYQDRADVQRVCRGLQAAIPPGLLSDRRLLYKPDIYTYLGIYSRNEWQLKPTILEARLP